jgi:hypothetical protein
MMQKESWFIRLIRYLFWPNHGVRTPHQEEILQNLKEEADKQAVFHQSLLDAGLVKQIKRPSSQPITERRLIEIEGKPISETIIEERR